MTIKPYTDLITSQHKTKPKFMAWLSAALEIIDDGDQAAKAIVDKFNIDTAVGAQLDIIGEVVGRSRRLNFQPVDAPPTLDDANYRVALKAKIAQNIWDGTIPQIYDIWYGLFDDVDLTIVDNQDMTMAALIEGNLDAVSAELIASGYVIPKPAGVGLTIIEVNNVDEPVYLGLLVSEIDHTTVTIPYGGG